MKITQLRGDLAAFRNLELSIVLNAMKTENSRKPVTTLRQNIPYLTPGIKSLAAEKIPVVLFGVTLKRDDERIGVATYAGLVLLSIGNLIDYAEAAAIRDRAAGFPQTLASFVGSSGRSVKIVVPFTLSDGSLPKTERHMRLFHAHACLRAGRYYEAQLQLPVEWKEEGCPTPEQGCRVSYDPDLYYNPDALPIRLEQPLQMPAPVTTREAHDAETDPLLRMAPGYERYKRISLLYETSLTDTFRQVGPEDGGDEGRKKFIVHLARKCRQSAIPEEDVVCFALIHPFGREQEMELRVTFGNVYRKEKHCSVRPCMPRRMLVAMQMEEFMTRRYELRFNRMKGCKEYRERHSLFTDYRPVTAEAVKSICFEAQLEGISAIEYDVQRYVDSRRVSHYWPIEEFLFDLPHWDGQDRIRALADCVPCENKEWRDFFIFGSSVWWHTGCSSRETLERLAAILTEKSRAYGHPIYLISDEPYREIVFSGFQVPWIPQLYPDTIVCYSFSKSLSLPGERLGYVLVPGQAADSGEVYAAVAGAGRSLGYVNAPQPVPAGDLPVLRHDRRPVGV